MPVKSFEGRIDETVPAEGSDVVLALQSSRECSTPPQILQREFFVQLGADAVVLGLVLGEDDNTIDIDAKVRSGGIGVFADEKAFVVPEPGPTKVKQRLAEGLVPLAYRLLAGKTLPKTFLLPHPFLHVEAFIENVHLLQSIAIGRQSRQLQAYSLACGPLIWFSSKTRPATFLSRREWMDGQGWVDGH